MKTSKTASPSYFSFSDPILFFNNSHTAQAIKLSSNIKSWSQASKSKTCAPITLSPKVVYLALLFSVFSTCNLRRFHVASYTVDNRSFLKTLAGHLARILPLARSGPIEPLQQTAFDTISPFFDGKCNFSTFGSFPNYRSSSLFLPTQAR